MTHSKAELQKMAKEHFEALRLKKLFATSDGQFFVLESRALLHAGSSLTVYALEDESQVTEAPEGGAPETPNNAPSVKALTELIANETDLVKLNNTLLEEISGPNRKSAVTAIEKRIAVLTDLRKES